MKLPILKSENEVPNTVLAIGFDMERHRGKLLYMVFTKICLAAGVGNDKLSFNGETGEVFINLDLVGIYTIEVNGGKTVISFIPIKKYMDSELKAK